MATYYKFKTQELADEAAAAASIPLLAHTHWVFKNPISNFNLGTNHYRIDRDSHLETVDISKYPEFITVKMEDGSFFNYPLEIDSARYSVYYSYGSPSLNDRITGKGYYLKDMTIPDFGPDSDWSSPMTKYVNHTDDYLREQIRVRYGMFNRPTNGLSNVIIDSFFPRMLYNVNMNTNMLSDIQLPSTAVAISPLVANLLNVKQVPTEQLCRTLGYNIKDIKTLLTTLKRKQINFVFAGAGGTGMNTAYWLRELCKMTNTVNLFRKIWVYDNDNAELSNLLRFPVDIRTLNVQSTRKIDIIAPFTDQLSTNKAEYVPSYITDKHKPYAIYTGNRIRDNFVIYGAPSVESRNALSESGGFICATHAATSASVWLNPHQDTDIQVESYGLIQLGGFFMNQLKMAITLLEILGNDDLDLHEQDKSLLEYEFDGTRVLPTDRTYQWQIAQDMLMMTAEQANTI